ncbi:MAG: multiheme c-type cytochrome, partial [Mariprofundaceae bacterium]
MPDGPGNARLRAAILSPALLFVGGLLLAGAAADPGLPSDYWGAQGQPPIASGSRHPTELENDLHPESCAQCHAAQYEAWRGSRHARAWSLGMLGQFPGMGHAAANDCLNCHAPLAEQRFGGDGQMRQAVADLAMRPVRHAPEPDWERARSAPLARSGVSCAACHVRGGQRLGPPPRGNAVTGTVQGPAHGGFTATRAFEDSSFCAECHQFPQSEAVNGKPLENTLVEWRQSRFAREGVSCQGCHMPDRSHGFRGIHDRATVRGGLEIRTEWRERSAVLLMRSARIGHAFPSYVTPQVRVRAEALDGAGRKLRAWHWRIGREVMWREGWREMADTRLMPGEERRFVAGPLTDGVARVRFTVEVAPDHFYQGVYRDLLRE